MPVEDGEELDLKLGLLAAVRLNAGLLEVEHDRDAVLVVVADEAVVRVGTVGDHVRRQRLLRDLGSLDDRPVLDQKDILSFEHVWVELGTQGHWRQNRLVWLLVSQSSTAD